MNQAAFENPPFDRPPFNRRAIPDTARESVWLAADGHAIRRIDWDVAGETARGSILFMPGRGDNYEKYLETLDGWHRDGWCVTAADWRGQAGSGRFGSDDVTGHIKDFSVWIADLAAFWREWVAATPGPHIIAGHSMGGHLVLRALVERAIAPKAAVLVAPMLGYYGTILPLSWMQRIAKLLVGRGAADRPAWKWSEKPGETPVGRINLLTHDTARYEDELHWRKARPELVMGPGSWHWVERGYASMQGIFAKGALEAVETPVLLLAARKDKLVDHRAIARAAKRLPAATLEVFGAEARHEILREVDPVRDRALSMIEHFLDKAAPSQR